MISFVDKVKNSIKLTGKSLGYNSIFGKYIYTIKISASITFFVREVLRSLVPLHNLGEFKFLNNIFGFLEL